jgi:hypothetical protein
LSDAEIAPSKKHYARRVRPTMQKSGAPFEEMKREARLLGEPMSEQDQPPQKLRFAETPEEQKKWMAQWRSAEVALLEVKREELRALSDEEAQAACDLLLANADEFYVPPQMKTSSGLVEQQRIFMRARR